MTRKASRKIPVHHAHGCVGCRTRYMDSCRTPAVNERCIACRTGAPRVIWEADYDPRPCCRDRPVLVTDTETLNRYALGGSSAWWQCRTCARTHPYDPSIEV